MKFSVLLSLYDKENPIWLDICLSSLLINQTLLPSEVVIVEDGPLRANLSNILNKYEVESSVPFKRIKLKTNRGLGEALNIGLENCEFELVARMDTDDEALSTRFEKQVRYFKDNIDTDILGSCAIEIDEFGNELELHRVVPEKNKDIYDNMWASPLLHPTVMFKKSFILSVGSYSTLLKRRQDYDLWFRCALAGAKFHNLQENTLKYRIASNSNAKNSLEVRLTQALIGLKGSFALRLGLKAYIGVFYPVFKTILPEKLRLFITNRFRRFHT